MIGDVNPFINESLNNRIHIWHEIDANGHFKPYRNLTVQKALAFINNDNVLPKMSIIEVNEKEVQPFIGMFTYAMSMAGMYMHVELKQLIIPANIVRDVENYLNQYGLTEYKDLMWYLIARLQIFYTQRITIDVVGNKEYTKIIYNAKEDYIAIQKLVEYVEGESKKINSPLTLTIKQGEYKHTIKERGLLAFLLEGFIKGFLKEDGKLIPDWRDKILNFESSQAIKESLEKIHQNVSIAFIEFLKRMGIVTGDKIDKTYLNPAVELLNLSQYPFINDGDRITSKHIKSVLKNAGYSLPSE